MNSGPWITLQQNMLKCTVQNIKNVHKQYNNTGLHKQNKKWAEPRMKVINLQKRTTCLCPYTWRECGSEGQGPQNSKCTLFQSFKIHVVQTSL